jgi:hypothetical protein
MVTKRKPKKLKRKRGPKEERLIIKGDPEAAIAKLLHKQPTKR